MGALGTYCFDGLNFSQASSLYTNSTLSVLAADGFYSQGGIVRQQLNGVLLNAQACSTCQPDVTLFNLCFAVTENDLCCDTSTPVAVYAAGLNVANLSSVVGDLYKDSFLQIKADNGFYSDDSGITCSSSTLTKFDTSVGNPTGNCSSPQLTSLYFQVISPATNQAPLVTNSVFSDANGTIPLNNTSTTMYYIASLTAYGVRLGVVVSIAACTTPPTGISYTLQNGTQSDLTYSYTNTSGGVVSGFLGGFEGQTICAKANTVSADTGITISTGSSC